MKTSAWIIAFLITLSLLVSGCGPAASTTPTPLPAIETPVLIKPQAPNLPTQTPTLLGQYMVPPYYADSYISIINDSKGEGVLKIYSSLPEKSWNSVIRVFNSHYSWIRVEVLELGATGVFDQYNQDIAENKPTADMLVSSDPIRWLQFFESRKALIYSSQEDPYIPDMAKSVYGTYAFSSEPMIIIYNKKLVSTPPQSLAELADLIGKDPAGYQGQVATGDADLNGTAYAINWFWTDSQQLSGWEILNAIGKSHPVLLASESEVVERVGKGEARIGYFIPAGAVIPHLKTYPDLGWAYLMDNQPVLLNSMAINRGATSPNSAKLMLDFILSQEGQYALSLGGLTPYRSDISGITTYHLDKIFTELGDSGVTVYSFDTRLNNQALMENFIEKWRNAVQKADNPPLTASPTP
jgi:iron(III) transport system substrate-binding protein